MTDKWKLARKLMSSFLCRTTDYMITAKFGGRKYICTTRQDQPMDASITSVTPEELNAMTDTFDIWRIDAVTEPTFPIANATQLLDLSLPGCCNTRRIGGNDSTPVKVIRQMSDYWHDALEALGIKIKQFPELHEIRADIGQIKYAGTASEPPPHSITMMMCDKTPYGTIQPNSAQIQCPDTSKEFPDEVAWMKRAIFEMLPVRLYQNIIFGDHKYVYRNDGDLYEYTTVAVLDPTPAGAHTLFEKETDLIPLMARAFSPTAFGCTLCLDDAMTRINRDLWKSRDSLSLSGEYHNGMIGTGLSLLPIALSDEVVCYSKQLEAMTLNNGDSDIRQRLVSLHEGDALSSIIGNVWEE